MGNLMQQNTPPLPQFYRLPQVTQLLGVSGSTIWNWVKKGTFPRPIKLSVHCSAWRAIDIDTWAAERIALSQEADK